jgi:hypothetical protein
MTGSATATLEAGSVESDVAREMMAASVRSDAAPMPAPARPPAPAKAVAVPVNRAVGGPRARRRSDQRWQVTEADLNMYGLIVGRAPSESERVAALTPVPNEATALRDAGAGRGGMMRWGQWNARGGAGAEGPTWSPSVMFSYLRDVYYFSTNLTAPQVTAWVRHVSTEARRRLQETQARLASARTR